jgi:GTP-binding protein EngB required for normal cell division
MKKLILASLALLLICSAIPAMAGEKAIDNQEPAMFQALSKLSGPGQVVLNKMSDEQLSKIEGEGYFKWVYQNNTAVIKVNNINSCLAICGSINKTGITVVQTNVN